MWIKKLKKKKFQFALVALMLCFTSAIFSACISFAAETSKFNEQYTSYENCPRYVAITSDKYDEDYFKDYDELMAKTKEIKFCDVSLLKNNFYFNGKQIKTYYNMAFNVENMDNYIYDINMIEGNEKVPLKGEIWISSVCADSYDISLGDTIHAGSADGKGFKVSGIVATQICPSPYMGNLPYYINPSTAEMLDGTEMKAISFFSNEEMSGGDFQKVLPKELASDLVTYFDADSIRTSISYLADIFGGVGLLAATIIFAVSLVIIKFIIVSNLANEYKEIGTYKALGFKDSQIIGVYLKSFIFSGGIGVTIGAILSFQLTRYLCGLILRNLGTFELSEVSVILACFSILILTSMLAIGVEISLKKIRKITPIEAFSAENPSSKKKIGHSLIKNAYSPFSVAVNDIVHKKSASIVTLIVLTVSFYMSILFSSVNYSLDKFGDMTGEWFAFPQYDAIISLNSKEEVKTFLNKSESVDKYVFANLSIEMAGMRTNSDVDINGIYIEIYDDCSKEKLGIPLVEGRHPEADDEILISYNLSKKSGINIGEYFHIENDEYSNDYLVTGTFSSMFDGGLNIIMDGEEYRNFKCLGNYKQAMVFLNDGVSYEDFEKEMKNTLPETDISETASFLEGSINSLNSISKPLTTMFVIIFSAFSVLNIVNVLIMNNIENRRQYGILKAMGFTNRYICIKNLLKIVILTAISSIVAVLLHVTLSQKFFFTVIHVNGLVDNPSLVTFVTTAIFSVITFVTLMFTIPMIRVSPTELMEE